MEFIGTIKAVLPPQEGVSKTGAEWKKQEFVIEDNSGQYPQSLVFNVFGQDRIDELQAQGMKSGAVGKVFVSARTHYYNGRWYNNFTAWKWEVAPSWEKAVAQNQPAAQSQGTAAPLHDQQATLFTQNQQNDDDLPF